MLVIVKEPGKPAERREVPNEAKPLQEIVGGWMETVRVGVHLLMVCNEQGKLLGLPYNFTLGNDDIVGTVFFAGYDRYDFTDLDEDQIGIVAELLGEEL